MTLQRRQLLGGLAGMAGSLALPVALRAAGPDSPYFPLGVASGSPTDHSVVIWTRLFPSGADVADEAAARDLSVRFEVATDAHFRRVVARGPALAEARFALSVHHVVRGLSPARDYWYRFLHGGQASPVGRTRTLPARHAAVSSLHLAVASCQHWEHGHYAALGHLARETPDLVLHVGDYIYEGAPTPGRVRQHTGGLCRTLADYRQRYALYHTDPALQAAHQAAPWLLVWDDHEVANDYSGDRSGRDEEPASFLRRRAAAYQAWYEHLPVPPSMAPDGSGAMRIHARHALGRLATLHLLDQRQYRSPQACPQPGRAGGNRFGDACTERVDAGRTMLGAAQEAWLARGLTDVPARWTLLGQGTVFAHVDEQPGPGSTYWSDGWTGYPAARQRLLDTLRDTRSTNPVIFSGDLHAFVVAGIPAVAEQPDSGLLAAEFVTSSLTSDPRPQAALDVWRDNNPHLQLVDGRRRGYLSVRVTPQRLQADLVAIDDATRPDAARSVLRSCVVEAGSPVILPA